MKRLFTCIALVAMSIGAWAWTWTGTTPAGNNSYYLYSKNQSGFLKASGDGWDEPSYGTWGLATHGSGDAGSGRFTFTSSAGKQIAMWRTGAMFYTYYVSASANDKTGDAIQMTIGQNGGYYSIYRSNKSSNWSGDRNISTTSNGIQRAKDASYEWLFVDDKEVAVYNNRNLTFSAVVANATDYAENAVSVELDATSGEVANYADRLTTKAHATFTAKRRITGYNFDGWYSDADFNNALSSDTAYSVNLSYEKQSVTLYAKYVQGAVSTIITPELTNLDWYTTYAIADLFSSNNPNPMVVTRDGVAIEELTTKNESSITLKVSQAAVTDEYEAATDVEFTFTVAPASACAPVVILSNAAESSKIEESATAVYSWGFAADVHSISYEFKTAFASNKTIYLDQLVDGTWKNVWSSTNRPTGYTPNTVNLSANHESATALRFRMSGGGTGSMWVKNVVINGENGISVPEKRDTTLAEVNDLTNIDGGVIELGYTSVATIQYEITDVAATNGNATVVLTPQETIDNECGDFGAYHFAVTATCTERVSVITANAHFFTADGYDKVVPIQIELSKQSQTLAWNSEDDVTIFDDENLEETATATSSLDVTYSSSNEDVVKYENGAWVVVAAGEATIYADQAGNDTYEAAAQISKQVTVLSRRYSKESGELAWNTMTTDPTKSMYKEGSNLITKTAFGNHGTICLPYKATVTGAVVYEYQGAEYDADHNVTGLVFDYIAGTTKETSNYVEAGKAYVYFATEGTQVWTKSYGENPAEDVVVPEEDLKLVGTYSQISLLNHEYFLHTEDDMFHPAGQNVVMPAFRACIPNMPEIKGAPVRLIMPKAGVATGVENATDYKAVKVMINGQVVILRGAKAFNVAGQAL